MASEQQSTGAGAGATPAVAPQYGSIDRSRSGRLADHGELPICCPPRPRFSCPQSEVGRIDRPLNLRFEHHELTHGSNSMRDQPLPLRYM